MNSHIEYVNDNHWGYAVVEFVRENCIYVGYAVDKTVNAPDSTERSSPHLRPRRRGTLEGVTEKYRASGW